MKRTFAAPQGAGNAATGYCKERSTCVPAFEEQFSRLFRFLLHEKKTQSREDAKVQRNKVPLNFALNPLRDSSDVISIQNEF